MHIEFYGAASGVTGSCHIIRVGDRTLLLDCGLLQGRRKDIARNREGFPFAVEDIDAVVLSHGHIDHSGRLPLLVRQGYRGPIYAHDATVDLCDILLQDSAHLHEKDAEYENRRRAQKHEDPISPLYTVDDAREALRLFKALPYSKRQEILPGVELRYRDAGHILGSCIVELWLQEDQRRSKIVFSGDLGQYDTPILNDPEAIDDADHLIVESTYGDRRHRDRDATLREIGEIIAGAAEHRGNLLIPAFAIGRTQELLYYFGKYYEEWNLDRWQVFLDSPMAIRATRVYWDHPHLYDDEATKLRREVNEMPLLDSLKLTSTTEESMAINQIESGAIIIAASGMCTGGRILHHLRYNLPHDGSAVMIVGHQAPGTLGRALVDGTQRARIYGEEYAVRAKVHTVGGLSAHADIDDLCRWVRGFDRLSRVHIVHGEAGAKENFRKVLTTDLGLEATIPAPGTRVEL